eukprot:jgi/Hompol1/262/HPOL_005267-RA
MGGGLLQKVHRDTMSFATKLCSITYADGAQRDVMKMPKTESGKISLPGELKVIRNADGLPVVYPAESHVVGEDELVVVYDHGKPVISWDSFATVRERVATEWSRSPLKFDPVSQELKQKITKVMALQTAANSIAV